MSASFDELLDAIAARTPAPGGGTSAAWSCAIAAALVEMAARFTDSRSATATRARELRARALELAEQELHAYEPVLAALRLPRDDPSRESRLRAALSHAAQSPLELVEAAAELAELGCELTHDGNPNLEGDALAGTLLAEAACAAATRLVEINLADILDDPRPAQARGLAARAGAARDRALR